MQALIPPETSYRIHPHRDDSRAGGPLWIEAAAAPDLATLCEWLRGRPEWVQQQLTEHGAIFLRGFAVKDAPDFEQLARAIDDDLKNEYLGTSPRDGLTDYVFSASELPGYYPIPQHCEMSFTANPPRRVLFCCLEAPAAGSGETPLCDFRRVWSDLDPTVRERFERGGIRIVRNYSGPGGGGRFDLWKLKRWDEMFLTHDRAEVEAKCAEQGFEPIWTDEDGLRLVSTQPVSRTHPVSGEPVWHNHTTTFHLTTAPAEYERIQRYRPSWRNWAWWQLSRALVALQRRSKTSDELSMHCTYADGSEIPDADMDHVRDVVWKHLIVIPWRRGDVVVIDNHSVSHGRLPYRGARRVAVCWA